MQMQMIFMVLEIQLFDSGNVVEKFSKYFKRSLCEPPVLFSKPFQVLMNSSISFHKFPKPLQTLIFQWSINDKYRGQ